MDKTLGEDEVKGLEEEIDSAVDRLFVEIKKGLAGEVSMEPSVVTPPLTVEKEDDLDLSFASSLSDIPSFFEPSPPPPPPPPSPPPSPAPFPSPPKAAPSLNPLEKLETHVLSLEWEMTKENLKKAMEEISAVRALVKEDPQTTSTLNLMGKVISYMMKNEGDVTPPFVKFLLDSKETVKLLMKKEMNQETATLKQLAYAGIEARFACLEGLRETPPLQPSVKGRGEMETTGVQPMGGEKMHELLSKINLFLEKTEELIKRMGERTKSGSGFPLEAKSPPAQITVFKIGDKFFGVESEKVFKLFKVPDTFQAKVSSQSKVLLKGLEVKMIDLKKRFSIVAENRKEAVKILTVNDQGEVKGWIIDQILKQVSATPEREGEGRKDVLGKIHWTYKDQQVTIPILDTKRL